MNKLDIEICAVFYKSKRGEPMIAVFLDESQWLSHNCNVNFLLLIYFKRTIDIEISSTFQYFECKGIIVFGMDNHHEKKLNMMFDSKPIRSV